jgi:hypothetical protein
MLALSDYRKRNHNKAVTISIRDGSYRLYHNTGKDLKGAGRISNIARCRVLLRTYMYAGEYVINYSHSKDKEKKRMKKRNRT